MAIRPALAPLRKLIKLYGEPEVLRRWRLYLAATDGAYASAARFAATWGTWGTTASVGGGRSNGVAQRTFDNGMRALRDLP